MDFDVERLLAESRIAAAMRDRIENPGKAAEYMSDPEISTLVLKIAKCFNVK